ncbi:MAG: amino acid adenylation domain-containing protein [Clostridiales bacterium]|nr:amino acid adenylation domain-containing protein [Clostridiales bacterium]
MRSVLEYLEASVRRDPGRCAYRDLDKSYSFGEVSRIARAIGSRVGSNSHGSPVAILMEKSASMIVAMLGAVYGGCCYCPIDVSMPEERMRTIFDVLQPASVITGRSCLALAERLNVACPVYVFEDMEDSPEDAGLLARIRKRSVDSDPLYILFTSGSTGVPKGVVVSHRVVINNMEWLESEYRFSEEDVLGNQVPFYFDVSDHDVYCPLKFGCSTVVIPPEYFSFPAKLIPFLNEHKVTAIFWVPFALSVVANLRGLEYMRPDYLRYIFFAGEVMPMKQLNYWRRYLPDALYANMYGPTETYVCTYYNVDREFSDNDTLPIGFPCGNVDIMVLDEQNRLVTPETGGEGELCVRGCTLACGYYNNSEQTAARFVQNPLNPSYPERIYRTGDLVSYNERGELLYHDRMDYQIKRLGYRIELGEIEAAAGCIDGIRSCACIYDPGKQMILFFYEGTAMEKKAISRELSQKLPRYMMPNRFIYLDEMPRNANGKIDRKRLKEQYL